MTNAIFGIGTLLQRGDGTAGGVQASKTIGTSNQQLRISAKQGGAGGNSKTFGIVVSGNNTAYSQVITANSVLINSATDGSGNATTTVAQAIANLYASPTFYNYFVADTSSGTGSGVLVAGASGALSGGSGAETFTTIPEVKNISMGGLSLQLADATNMDSPNAYQEWVPTFKSAGTINFDIQFQPALTAHKNFLADYVNRSLRNYQLVFPDTGATQWAFAGYLTNLAPSMPHDSLLNASGTITITGEPTFPA